MRIITGSFWNVHSAPLFKSTSTLTLRDTNTFQVAPLVYQAVNRTLPLSFNNYFIYNKDVPDHFTRRKENIHILHCNTDVRAFCVKNYGRKLWNTIPINIRSALSLNIFKCKLKIHLLQQYT